MSELITVTVRAPVVVAAAIFTFAVNLVDETNVVETTVTPDPNLAIAPARKCEPRMSTDMVVPRTPLPGDVDVGSGAA